MTHQLKRHLITLRFEYPTYAYDVNSDVNGKKTCAPNCSIRQTRNNSIVYDIPNRPDSSILHKSCTYDAIRHHNINKQRRAAGDRSGRKYSEKYVFMSKNRTFGHTHMWKTYLLCFLIQFWTKWYMITYIFLLVCGVDLLFKIHCAFLLRA